MIRFKGELPEQMTREEKEKLYKDWTVESWKVLVERNMRLAVNIANSFSNTEIEDDDLLSIALYGLVNAAKKFNPLLGYEFSTFSIPVMRNEILMELRKIKKHPYPKESPNDKVFNSEGECYEKGETLQSPIDIESFMLGEELIEILTSVIRKENERNQKVILLYLNGKTQDDISHSVCISQSYVSKIIKKFQNTFSEEYRRWG